MSEEEVMPGIIIKRYIDDAVLYDAPTAETVKQAVEEAVRARANLYGANLVGANLDGADLYGASLYGASLVGANLYGANLDGATRLTTGETWDEYLRETLPALLTAGGRALAEVATAEHWDCHNWGNCPMHAAFGAADIGGVPILLRPRAEQFIKFFDSKLIPLPAIAVEVAE